MMRDQFKKYLIQKGYKEKTESGKPSTVEDYCKRIDFVCDVEHCSWDQLAQNIDEVVYRYDIGGSQEDTGNRSHRSVINALKRFQEYCRLLP